MLHTFTRTSRQTLRRWTAPLLAAMLLVPLSATSALASVPNGAGLEGPIPLTCEDLGVVAVIDPPGNNDATSWDLNSGAHIVLQQVDATVTTADGQVHTFHKTWGRKTGLDTITCTGEITEGDATGQLTAVVAIVPQP